MENALELCGFNAQTIRYLISQGFNSPDDLLLATESELNSMATSVMRNPPRNMAQINMPFMALKNLKDFVSGQMKGSAPDLMQTLMTSQVKTSRSSRQNVRSTMSLKTPPRMRMHRSRTLWKKLTGGLSGTNRSRTTSVRSWSFTVNGEGWSYIKKFERSQDGRRAYLALKTQCEGTASKITRKNKAYASISNAVYSGSRRQYKFQDFINTHQTAHNEILDCDPSEAVPESKKVADFLKGITDPKLESAVSVVLGDVKLLNDFQLCQQYLSTTVENRATLEKSKERNISGLKSGGEKSDQKGKGGKLPKNFKLENKWYPPKIYRLLTQEQQDQLRTWNKDKDGKKSKGKKRSVAALKKQIKDVLKEVDKKRRRTRVTRTKTIRALTTLPERIAAVRTIRRRRRRTVPDMNTLSRWYQGLCMP
ncbi:hypothetical protein MHU86_17935 [Fragilaria crotonensis]|nr:hypothetical protein MHU86_17935 [Fragilaria crotonensis]